MILSLLVAVLFVSPAPAAKTMHGIRNEKCAESDADAKLAIGERIASDPKLCEDGFAAKQSGGYSCRSGGECKKGGYRCNTQYVCEPKAVDLSARMAPAGAPTPVFVGKLPGPAGTAAPAPTAAVPVTTPPATPTSAAPTYSSPTPPATGPAPSPTPAPTAAEVAGPNPMPNPAGSGAPTKAEEAEEDAPDAPKHRVHQDGDATYVEETKTLPDGKRMTSVRKRKPGEPLPASTPSGKGAKKRKKDPARAEPKPSAAPAPSEAASPGEPAAEAPPPGRPKAVLTQAQLGQRLMAAIAPVAKAIGECSPFRATVPDPLREGAPEVEMRVHGVVDGKCKFTQTNPAGDGQTCYFTAKERADIAAGGLVAFRTTMVDPEVCGR